MLCNKHQVESATNPPLCLLQGLLQTFLQQKDQSPQSRLSKLMPVRRVECQMEQLSIWHGALALVWATVGGVLGGSAVAVVLLLILGR